MEIFQVSLILNKFGDLYDVLKSVYGGKQAFENYELYIEYAIKHEMSYNEEALGMLVYAESIDKIALRDILRAQYKMDIQENDKEKKLEYINTMQNYIDYLSSNKKSVEIEEFKQYRKRYSLNSKKIYEIKSHIGKEDIEKFSGIDKEDLILELIAMYKYNNI